MSQDVVKVKTRFFGATDTEGARIHAWVAAGMERSAPYDHALNPVENHEQAAVALVRAQGVRVVDVVEVRAMAYGQGYGFEVAYSL